MNKVYRSFAIVLFLACSNLAFASGIELQEHSAAAHARGLAVKARLDEASTVMFNPAGLAYIKGFMFQIGDTVAMPNFNYSDPAGKLPDASLKPVPVPPPHGYFAWGGETCIGKLGLGLGVNFPFGMAMTWEDGFVGNYLIDSSDLQIPEVYLGFALAPIPEISIGAAFVVAPSFIYMKRHLGRDFGLVTSAGAPMEDATVEMIGSGVGYGVNFGIQARPAKDLYFGLAYRSRIRLGMEGEAHFNLEGLADKSGFPDQSIETEFVLPDIYSLAVGYQIHPSFYLEVDAEYTMYSLFEKIPLVFPEDKTGSLSQEMDQSWHDIFTLRIGGEWTLNEHLTLRAGTGYDQNPSPDHSLSPLLPDADRIFNTLGVGYKFCSGLSIDMAYSFTYFLERTVTGFPCPPGSTDPACEGMTGYTDTGEAYWVGNHFPATYTNSAQLVSFSLGYRW